jgi:hypothetical protein
MNTNNGVQNTRVPLLAVSVVGVTIPAAILTLLLETVGKEPPNFILFWAVAVVPSLLGFAAYRVALWLDPNPSEAFAPAVCVSFLASVAALVARVGWLVAQGY